MSAKKHVLLCGLCVVSLVIVQFVGFQLRMADFDMSGTRPFDPVQHWKAGLGRTISKPFELPDAVMRQLPVSLRRGIAFRFLILPSLYGFGLYLLTNLFIRLRRQGFRSW